MSDESGMKRAQRMCGTCPFKGSMDLSDPLNRECAAMPADHWPCHEEDLFGHRGIQCRGHFEIVRKLRRQQEAAK